MRLRSLVCLLLVLALGLFIAGCNNDTPPATESIDTAQESTPVDPDVVPDTPVVPEPSTPDVPSTEPSTPELPSPEPEVDVEREVAALVNDYPVYQDDLDEVKAALITQYSQTYAQFGMSFADLMVGADGYLLELGVEADAFQQLVQLALTQQEADQRGIEITDEQTQQEFDRQYAEFLVAQAWTEDDLSAYLAQQGQTLDEFKNNVKGYIHDQMLASRVQEAVAGTIDITDEQISEYFAANEAEYGTEEQVRASHILVETRELAEDLLAQLEEGADFAELATEHSIDPGSGANGGDLNWFGRGAMVAPFEEAAFALAIDELSEIVETDYGFHIILLTDRQDASMPELSDIADQVQEDLEAEIAYERAVEWYTGVRDAADFEINNPLLAAVIAQNDDIEKAIAILEQALIDETSDDDYLSFVLGTFYAQQLTAALSEREAAVTAGNDTTELDERIASSRASALASFNLALEIVGEDEGIQSKIDGIQILGDDEEETP